MTTDKITTIRVHESTKRHLAERGAKGESYEDIINALLQVSMELIPKYECDNPPGRPIPSMRLQRSRQVFLISDDDLYAGDFVKIESGHAMKVTEGFRGNMEEFRVWIYENTDGYAIEEMQKGDSGLFITWRTNL
jgi:hypothetical protein